jgi:hypothetical protein
MTAVQLPLVCPGSDVRHRRECAFNQASGELWMMVAQFCNTRDYGRLAVVSAQTNAGCKRYAHLFVRLPPGWTIQILGEEMRWFQRTFTVAPPPSTLVGLQGWMKGVATNRRLYAVGLEKAEQIRRSHQLSTSSRIWLAGLSFCCFGGCVGSGLGSSCAGISAGAWLANTCPDTVQRCCNDSAENRIELLMQRITALKEAWCRPLVAPPVSP